MSNSISPSNKEITTESPRILYVEWYKDAEEVTTRLLRLAGYEVTSVPTLAESVQLARAEHFDLYLISEYTSDYYTGVELCRQLRAFNRETPILFYSTLAYSGNQIEALSTGAQAYLTKPCEFDDLNQTIHGLIRDGRAN